MAPRPGWVSEVSRLGVVISGGAPTVHLAAGALCAFYEQQVSFDVVGTSGAGALPGLLYLAPKTADPATALRGIVNLNVYDAIHRLIPSNFKVFFKYGPFSPLFWRAGRLLPRFDLDPKTRYANAPQRLYNDLLDFTLSAFTPTTLNYWSTSVLNRVQVVDDLVDWTALKDHPKDFYLNTFSLRTMKLELVDKTKISPESFYAALAMPWLYPPTDVEGVSYTEGASHDPSGLEALKQAQNVRQLDAIVVLETIGPELWTDPEDLLEALELTIIDPIVTLAENVAALASLQDLAFENQAVHLPKIYRLPFDLSSWERGKTLEWSYSNALRLWEVGYQAAMEFCNELGEAPAPAAAAASAAGSVTAQTPKRLRPADKYRYLRTLPVGSRVDDFLGLFHASVANRAGNVPRLRPTT